MTLQQYKEITDKNLPLYLPKKEGEARVLYDAMAYSLLSGGKRLRAALFLWGAQWAGLDIQSALPFACAIEMIHAYSLIHDDLPCMDNDDMRRGKPTNHMIYGQDMALLAGDALLSQAFEVILNTCCALSGQSKTNAVNAAAYIAGCAGAGGMIAGQVADMEMHRKDENLLLYIERNKTAKMFMAALVGGLTRGGAPSQALRAFEDFAYNYGVAFQITDDILDETGDEATIGKPVKSDERNNKLTAVKLWGVEGAQALAKEHIDAAIEAIAQFSNTELPRQLSGELIGRDK